MNIVSTYTWCQFAPAFALVGLAALLILADALLPRIPKRAYALIGALGTFITTYFLWNGTHANLFGAIATISTGPVGAEFSTLKQREGLALVPGLICVLPNCPVSPFGLDLLTPPRKY